MTYHRLIRCRLPLAFVAALLISSCGGGDDERSSTPAAGAGAFPAVVEHEHGSTEIEQAPQRVVTLGYSDQDAVLAFGVAPVAVTDWYGDYPYAVWPWAQDELGDATPQVLNKGAFTGTANYNYEAIAAIDPDLIIGLYTDMNATQYDRLSQIAPTIAPSGDFPEYGMPWQETTRMVGAALGQPDRAEEIISNVEAQFAEAAAEHPEFAGVEMAVVEVFEPGQTFVRSATDPRTKFMTSLGFVLPDDLAARAGEADGAAISDEQLGLLDTELLVWNIGFDPTARAQIESKPLYPTLEVVQAGRSIFIDDPLVSGALTWATPLSLPFALERMVPQLAEAVEPTS